MLISSHHYPYKDYDFNMKMGDTISCQKQELLYLGVAIDSHLTKLCKKHLLPKMVIHYV